MRKRQELIETPRSSASGWRGLSSRCGQILTANLVTGTGGLSVPLAISPGRSGFGPSLTLGYDSGAGNGPFGIGWGIGAGLKPLPGRPRASVTPRGSARAP
ncbi:SpvB/TcaC N-terminal domain-containing protein [Streptomyces sp. NPDC050355]|uniref:SpvB/TcaC N-terminal domain-containing protein n=1 Tax=Streptomyces sp. NPDC050355 TaxID=3365609 RepID=UPI0037ACB1EA